MTDFPDDNNPRIGSRADYDNWFKSQEESQDKTEKTPEGQSSWVKRITEEKEKIKGDDGIER
jgi:hypothetical protein